MEEFPLVSIGIPTYNRPLGLQRTLKCITNQTYKNIEIIVSDNCSPIPKVKKVMGEFLDKDNRITYYRQENNIGRIDNFRFVLKKANGEYFMWAADDDEWDKDFILILMQNIGSKDAIFPNFTTNYRAKNKIIKNSIPKLSYSNSNYQNAKLFLKNMHPSLFYGVYRKETISRFLKEKLFDWYDCYFVLEQIINYSYITIPEKYLYTAGVDAENYIVKTVGQKLDYITFYKKSFKLFISSKKIHSIQKINLSFLLLAKFINLVVKKLNVIAVLKKPH